jgi:hypothetical protein
MDLPANHIKVGDQKLKKLCLLYGTSEGGSPFFHFFYHMRTQNCLFDGGTHFKNVIGQHQGRESERFSLDNANFLMESPMQKRAWAVFEIGRGAFFFF